MGTAADAVVADARKYIGQSKCDNCCASFVSQVFGETGHGDIFGSSASVPAIDGRFSGAAVSSDLGSAQPADLIVFGGDDHIMVYAGNGRVVGTAGRFGSNGQLVSGSTTVQETDVGAVSPSASKVLHTGLGNAGTSPVTVTVPFGSYFRSTMASAIAAPGNNCGQSPNYHKCTAADFIFTAAGQAAYVGEQSDGAATGQGAPTSAWYSGFQTATAPWVGRNYADLPDSLTVTAYAGPSSGLVDPVGTIVGGLFGTMFGWVPGFAITAGILVLAAALVFAGLREVASSVEAG